MPTAIAIGLPETCRRLRDQLALLDDRPRLLGCLLTAGGPDDRVGDLALLGRLEALESVVARLRPDLALVTLPASMSGLITVIRTRLRRAGVPDRFMPTLEDQLAGVGPRSLPEVDVRALVDRPPRNLDESAMRSAVSGRRVLITGAGGSIGTELARIAAQYGPSQLALVERSENALFEIDRQVARFHPAVARTALLHDIVDATATLAHFRRLRPQVIFHAAAHKHVPMMEDHPAAAVDNNLFGTLSVADAAAAVGAERFVMISTDKAVRPRSVMGATKRLAEVYVQHRSARSATVCSMVRFGNVLGSTGSVLDIWGRQLADGGPLTVTHPAMTRYFMTVAEAAALVVQSSVLVDPELSGSIYVLDMGAPVRVLDLARRFAALHGLEPVVGDAPGPDEGPGHVRIVFTGPRPGEKLHEQLAADASAIRPTAHRDIHCLRLPRPDPAQVERILDRLAPGRRPDGAAALAGLILELCEPSSQPVARETGDSAVTLSAMSKHPHREKSHGRPQRRAADGAIYVGLLMIGVFAISLWYVIAPRTWSHGLIGYVVAIAILVNLFAFQACRGQHLAGWQQSLARLPLRWIGFGTRDGKPLEAAKGSTGARAMLAVSLAASVVIVALLSFWLIPN